MINLISCTGYQGRRSSRSPQLLELRTEGFTGCFQGTRNHCSLERGWLEKFRDALDAWGARWEEPAPLP